MSITDLINAQQQSRLKKSIPDQRRSTSSAEQLPPSDNLNDPHRHPYGISQISYLLQAHSESDHNTEMTDHAAAHHVSDHQVTDFDADSMLADFTARSQSEQFSSAPAWDAAFAVNFHDVSSYQQFDFQHQTDPAIYNAPWPPSSTYEPQHQVCSSRADSLTATSDHSAPFFVPDLATTSSLIADAFAVSSQPTTDFNIAFPDHLTSGELRYEDVEMRHGSAPTSTSMLIDDAGMHLKLQSLPILDNLATQLIHTTAKASHAAMQDFAKATESEESQAYSTLKNLFDQTRKVYCRDSAFIDAVAIQIFQPSQQEIIRKANMATFISSVLGAHDVSFFDLNEFFLETFVPLGHRLLKWQSALFLELKTQTYISALMNSDNDREAMLDELFPADLDSQLLSRHPDAPSPSPSEQDFLDRGRARKKYLLMEPSTEESLRELPKKYQWVDFAREFASCINKNVDSILNVPARNPAVNIVTGVIDRRATQAGIVTLGDSVFGDPRAGSGVELPAGDLMSSLAQVPRESTDGTKKPSAPYSAIRQPWSKAEEDALVSGLEKVNGPHWSQILALYGRGGSISEILKDRNQVQLKDKARNLKLWYLKTGKEVPPSLRGVTGELRKRGGARVRAAFGISDEEGAAKTCKEGTGDAQAFTTTRKRARS